MNGNASSYLLRTKIHNQLISFFKKPIRIIYLVIFIALILLTMIGGNKGAKDPDRVIRDISELTAGINALFILIFATILNAGLKNGGTFFKKWRMLIICSLRSIKHPILRSDSADMVVHAGWIIHFVPIFRAPYA